MFKAIKSWWKRFSENHPEGSKFIMFFLFSNGVTVLQLAMMPILKSVLDRTSLLETSFVWGGPIGSNLDGSGYFIFDYPAGAISAGGGGGLAYFLAVQITLGIAQIINFFLQRNITFKSNTNAWIAAAWYLLAYVVITFVAAALQGFYKLPVYEFFMDTLGWGAFGGTVADVVTMIINSAISFWVFYPIFKVIFRQKPEEAAREAAEEPAESESVSA